MGGDVRFNVHPVFFDKIPPQQETKVKTCDSSEILYMGDAKLYKGFLRLPDLIRRKIAYKPEKNIQYNFLPTNSCC